jgi:glutaminase
MAGTLANRGTQPHSHKMIFNREANRNILSLMFSCGMYDTAGTWAYSVGIPAKSGVSGALIAILPNKMAIATYSPLIDKHGHSIRGVFAIKELSKKLSLNLFE